MMNFVMQNYANPILYEIPIFKHFLSFQPLQNTQKCVLPLLHGGSNFA